MLGSHVQLMNTILHAARKVDPECTTNGYKLTFSNKFYVMVEIKEDVVFHLYTPEGAKTALRVHWNKREQDLEYVRSEIFANILECGKEETHEVC